MVILGHTKTFFGTFTALIVRLSKKKKKSSFYNSDKKIKILYFYKNKYFNRNGFPYDEE